MNLSAAALAVALLVVKAAGGVYACKCINHMLQGAMPFD
jgi:hypothetical protein